MATTLHAMIGNYTTHKEDNKRSSSFFGIFKYNHETGKINGRIQDHRGYASIQGPMTSTKLEFSKRYDNKPYSIENSLNYFKNGDAWTGNWESGDQRGEIECIIIDLSENPTTIKTFEAIKEGKPRNIKRNTHRYKTI